MLKTEHELIIMNFYENNKKKFLFSKNIFDKNSLLKKLTSEQSVNYCFPYIYKKEFLIDNNIFFEKLRYAEDLIFITKVFSLVKKFHMLNVSFVKHDFNQIGLSSQINLRNDSSYLQAINFLEKFEKEHSFLSKIVINYIISRKKFCFYQFLLRMLKYELKEIINHNKKIINKSKKIEIKNNFYAGQKVIDINSQISNIKKKIFNFLKNQKQDIIALYGYGVVGKSIENLLKKNEFRNLIFLDDQNSKKNFFRLKLMKKNEISKINKFIICVPDYSIYKKIYLNLRNHNIKKQKIMSYFF